MPENGEKIITIVCRQLGIDEDMVDMETSLSEDLDADSLDIVEMMMAIEDAFGIEIPDSDIDGLRTIGDICTYIENNM